MEVEDAENDVGISGVKTKKKGNAAGVDDNVNNNKNKHVTFQASAAMYVRSVLFWNLTQRREVILRRSCALNIGVVPNRRFGTLSLSLCVA
jgi:hypothetical protein